MEVLEEKSGHHQNQFCIILWGPWMSAPNYMAINLIVVEIFHFGQQWWTNQQTDTPILRVILLELPKICALRNHQKQKVIAIKLLTCWWDAGACYKTDWHNLEMANVTFHTHDKLNLEKRQAAHFAT